jgi:arsenate reductase
MLFDFNKVLLTWGMQKVYFLSTCSTCQRICKQLGLHDLGFDFHDIKSQALTEKEWEHLRQMAGSYEALFSRQALKYKLLPCKPDTEAAYKNLLMTEYTFLKRPVIVDGNKIFIGNAKAVQEAAALFLSKSRR